MKRSLPKKVDFKLQGYDTIKMPIQGGPEVEFSS